MNLVDVHEELSIEDKLIICEAWEEEYNQRIQVGVLPFLDKDMVVRALCRNTLTQWEPAAPILLKLGIKLVSCHQEFVTDEDAGPRPSRQGVRRWSDIERLIDGEWITEKIEL